MTDSTTPAAPVVAPAPFDLTRRELEIAQMLALGNDGHEIAKALAISVKTFDTHRGHILKKMECKNTVQMTRKLLIAGVVSLTPTV